ncbi:NPCBM/NEW2 domain-containing protein [Lentisphaerota bacterium WC36G]|nr:NPCBM/NEW2 domain-containing protein [Lentisphaerae bacterium WC36]
MNKIKKLKEVVLLSLLVLPFCAQIAKAEDGKLKVLTYNIAALPWPAYYDNAAGDPEDRVQYIGQKLYPFDIVGVQEQFSEIDLFRTDVRMPFYTAGKHLYSGGSGLDLFSKFPTTPWPTRITFNDRPWYVKKGFTKNTVTLYPGVYVDVYNTHTGDDESDIEKQLDQISAYIQANSPSNRAVIVMGDLNATLDGRGNVRSRLATPNNLRDGYEEFFGNPGHSYWEIDRILFRNGDDVTFTVSHFERCNYGSTQSYAYHGWFVHNGISLSDHKAAYAELSYTINDAKKLQTGDKHYLSEIKIDDAWNSGFENGPIKLDRGIDRGYLEMNGVVYEKGICIHADSHIEINLDQKYSNFHAKVGIDEEVGSKATTVRFKVIADGTTVFDSGSMSAYSATQTVNLDVSNVNKIVLECDDEGNENYDHADWADAYFIVK